jgi:hypothetical protein
MTKAMSHVVMLDVTLDRKDSNSLKEKDGIEDMLSLEMSSRSVPINNSNGFNREDSTQCYNSKSVSELEQLNNTNCCSLTGNDIPFQSKLNSDQGNPCIDNQYDERKLLIVHQNI